MVNALPITGLAAVIIGAVGVYGGGGRDPPIFGDPNIRNVLGNTMTHDSFYYLMCRKLDSFHKNIPCSEIKDEQGNKKSSCYHERLEGETGPNAFIHTYKAKYNKDSAFTLKYNPRQYRDDEMISISRFAHPTIGGEGGTLLSYPALHFGYSGTDLDLPFCDWGVIHPSIMDYIYDPAIPHDIWSLGVSWVYKEFDSPNLGILNVFCRKDGNNSALVNRISSYLQNALLAGNANEYAQELVNNILCKRWDLKTVMDKDVRTLLKDRHLKVPNSEDYHVDFMTLYKSLELATEGGTYGSPFLISVSPRPADLLRKKIMLTIQCYNGDMCMSLPCFELKSLPGMMYSIVSDIFREYQTTSYSTQACAGCYCA